MEYIISVDAGGTKTTATLYDLKGKSVKVVRTGFGNVLINFEKAVQNIKMAVDELLENQNLKNCLALVLGIAGVTTGNMKERVLSEFEKLTCLKLVINDAQLAHAAFFKGNDGLLTIAGTGSVSLLKKDQHEILTGGWGHLLGDEGSGYWIAIKGMKVAILENEIGADDQPFLQALLDFYRLNQIEDLKKLIYSSTKKEIASFAIAVVKLENDGNTEAHKILCDAGNMLAEMTKLALKKGNVESEFPIAVMGSILLNVPTVKENFCLALNQTEKCFNIINDDVAPTKGGYYLALKELQKS